MSIKEKENKIAIMMFIGLVSHYCFGYFFWGVLPKVNIYYLTVYFNMDVWGFTVFMCARKSELLKGMGCLGMVLGSYFFYMEFNDPATWTQRDYMTLAMMFFNVFFIWVFTEKNLNKRK